jgi:hypothetical protein
MWLEGHSQYKHISCLQNEDFPFFLFVLLLEKDWYANKNIMKTRKQKDQEDAMEQEKRVQ